MGGCTSCRLGPGITREESLRALISCWWFPRWIGGARWCEVAWGSGGEEGLSPHLLCWEVRHAVLWCGFIKCSASSLELWARAIPAGVAIRVTAYAVGGTVQRARVCPMVLCAGATGIAVFSTVPGHVAPPLALQATERLFFVLGWAESL